MQRIKDKIPTYFPNPHYQAYQGTDEELLTRAVEKWTWMQSLLKDIFNQRIQSPLRPSRQQKNLYFKMDANLPGAGSIKARGGFYEVISYGWSLALTEGLVKEGDPSNKLLAPTCKDLLSQYTIVVGSTGNLGLSIGTMARALGFQTIVHMSLDAKPWKMEALRSLGARVIAHSGDYEKAVDKGRRQASLDEKSYFIDDEQSHLLFEGYMAAAREVYDQLEGMERPLHFYLPCGVGGAPGGIAYGLKALGNEDIHLYFVEPVEAPAVLLGIVTKLHDQVSVYDYFSPAPTIADGLNVHRPSAYVTKRVVNLIKGFYTLEDATLRSAVKEIKANEDFFLEPSAAAGYAAYQMHHEEEGTHIVWTTGGSLVPLKERAALLGD